MILLEYEAKNIIASHNIAIPSGQIMAKDTVIVHAPFLPLVIKAQVPIGGRGKLGGIRVIDTGRDYEESVKKLWHTKLRNHLPSMLLLEEKLDIDREFYLSLLIDAASADILIVAHPSGGIEVEENDQDDFLKLPYVPGEENRIGESLAELFDLPDQVFVLQDMVRNLGQCFVKNDATLLEVNPLILTKSGDLVVADCKMTLDDAAAFRHPEWDFETPIESNNFVELDATGTIATVANGAGLAMATVDAVTSAGYRPINFLDVGGGASEDLILESFTNLQSYPNIKAIVINIFAGITRCDDVAKAIVAAKNRFPTLPPLYIRLTGTNFDEAATILNEAHIELQRDLDSCLKRLVKEVARG